MDKFNAIVIRENNNELNFKREMIDLSSLSEGNVIVHVNYSSLNYKDMLGFQLNGGVIKNYPMIPGIDFSGEVVQSDDPDFVVGDEVVLTGYDVGMAHTGGFSEYARVPGKWLVHIPATMSMRETMVYGTAGFTAALAVDRLQRMGMNNPKARILIAGVTGGVGSVALAILKNLGYENITGMVHNGEREQIARDFGADHVITSSRLDKDQKPLTSAKYDFAIDAVGGEVTSQILPAMAYDGIVAITGNAGGNQLFTTVLPFILRAVSLVGIDSVSVDMETRNRVWNLLAREWDVTTNLRVDEISMDQISEVVNKIKDGQHIGRTIVKM